jgi:S-DNA-T family DNA segregation ATPase FtsK/SpoIIIE
VQVVYQDGVRSAEVELGVGRPDVLVRDLATALAAHTSDLLIDGRPVPASRRLADAGLLVGATVRAVGGSAEKSMPRRVEVRVVGGLRAGTSAPLGVGTGTVGRDSAALVRLDDPAVSRAHCRIEVRSDGQVHVTDMGSRNGTDVNGARISAPTPVGPDDLIGVGGVALLRVIPTDRLDPPVAGLTAGLAGTIPFGRQPRFAQVPDPAPIKLPDPPAHRAAHTFNLTMIIGAFVMAGAFVLITNDLRYAAIAALSPLMLVANWIEDRTRGRRSLRRQVRRFGADLATATDQLTDRHAAELRLRRAGSVDPAEALFRARTPSPRLWERRPAAADFQVLSVGIADLAWSPPVEGDAGSPEVAELLDRLRLLPAVPVPVSLRAGTVLGLDGHRRAALAVARSLLAQAAVTAGPADLTVAVFVDADRVADWDWTKWLPHVIDRGSVRRLAIGPAEAAELAGELRGTPQLLAVVDGAGLLEGRPCPLRDLLADRERTAAIVLADRLPAQCTATLAVAADGAATLRRLTEAGTVPGILATGMPEPAARDLARALARFEDPELHVAGAGLPDQVALLPLLGVDLDPAALLARWRAGAASLRARAVLGVTEDGLFEIDLDDDGPHGLIAGTTGSGKSELLRTLVAALAMSTDPEHLTFALIDYKGGGALDECARLPHSVGLVTDLDEHLGERALRCLEAELRHREQLLRRVGLNHVRDYQRWRDTDSPAAEPMPRLVVVIDEFATLVKALPDFVDALVGIAQRGRSLGMHLILATQRPAGSVSESIKNNTKLRVALRLESASDSVDVIDAPVAAEIGGRQWGRAFHRLSAREVRPVQTALSTAVSRHTAAALTVRPFRFGPGAGAAEPAAPDGPTDLRRMVDAAGAAFASSGHRPPRRPWPPPLPAMVTDLPAVGCGMQTATAGLPAFVLADAPDQQAQYPVGWDPAAGNLLLYGVVGAGTSTALAALALAWAQANPPAQTQLYVLDMGAGELAALGALPHTGAYVGATERERQVRLIKLLRAELATRKAVPADRPQWIVLVDNIAALTSEFDRDLHGMNLLDDLARVYADGPAVGIHFAVTADRGGSVPHQLASLTQQKLLFRLADSTEYALFDVPRNRVPTFVPGRAVVAATSQATQIRFPGKDLPAAVDAVTSGWPGAARTAPEVGVLPARVSVSGRASTSGYPWQLPIGVDSSTLGVAELVLYEHEHVLIAGPARSGRTTALRTIAELLARADRPPAVRALTPRRATLPDAFTDPAALVAALPAGPVVLLVDDADQITDKSGDLERLLDRPDLHVVATGRADNLRRAYGHWTQRVRESRCGVLLCPDHDLDGDLLAAELPRLDRLAALPGRGYLAMNGDVTGVHLAVPSGGARTAKERP